MMIRVHCPIACLVFCIGVSLTVGLSTNSALAGELVPASSAPTPTITFTNKSGMLISDAEVVRTNGGVSLVWEKEGGASGGVIRLEDLPEVLRVRFGYDSTKTAAADQLEKQRRTQFQQSVIAAQATYLAQQNQLALNQSSALENSTNLYPVYTSPRSTPLHRHYIRYVRPTRSHPTPVSKPSVNKTGGGQK